MDKELSVRIDNIDGTTLDKVKNLFSDKLDDKIDKIIIALEKPNSNAVNLHYQIYIKSSINDVSMRRFVKKYIECKGNKDFSVSKARKNSLSDYVCKGNSKGDFYIVYKKGYTDDEIVKKHNGWYEKKDEIKKKKTYKSKTNEIEDIIDSSKIDLKVNINSEKLKLVYKIIIKYYIDNDNLINISQITKMIQHYLIKNNPNYLEAVINQQLDFFLYN